MVLIKSFVLAGLAAAVAAKSAVLDLIPDNFDKVVLKSGKPTLVEFFAPWCGHCKKLAPVYEELGEAFAKSDAVQIAKVDADAEKTLGKRFGVQGFPTLKWFDGKSEEPTEYEGGRDFDSLANFVTDKTGVKPKRKLELPSEVEMLTDTTFKEIIGGDKDVLVAFTAPWCGRKSASSLTLDTNQPTSLSHAIHMLTHLVHHRLQGPGSYLGNSRARLHHRAQRRHRQG